MNAEPDVETKEPVSEAAWAVTSFIATSAFVTRALSENGFLWYASLVLTAIALALSVVLLVRSVKNGTDSWSWASVAVSVVTVGAIRLLV